MLFPRLTRHCLTRPREKDAPIGPQHNEALVGEALEPLGHRRLCDPKSRRHIDLPRLAAGGDEIGDEFDIICRKRRPPRRAGVPEARGMLLHFEERRAVLADHSAQE